MSGRAPVALGFRAIRGGAVVVGVSTDAGAPRGVLATFLSTAAEGDRLALEPYHVAYELAQGSPADIREDARAVVAEGRRRQDALAAKSLGDLLQRLREDGFEPAVAALLVNRAGWMTDLLAHALSAPEHPAVIEGLAVREALRSAFSRCALRLSEMDEKSLPETASAMLDVTPAALEAQLKALAATAKPWRREQKLAALAAWLALAAL